MGRLFGVKGRRMGALLGGTGRRGGLVVGMGAPLPVTPPCFNVAEPCATAQPSLLAPAPGIWGPWRWARGAGEVLGGLWAAPRPLQPPPRSRASDAPCSAIFQAGFPPLLPPSPICSLSVSPASPPAPFVRGGGWGDAHVQLLPTGPPAQPRVPLVLSVPVGLGSISLLPNPLLKGKPLPYESGLSTKFYG